MLEYELDELQQNLYWSTSIMEGNKFAPGFSQLLQVPVGPDLHCARPLALMAYKSQFLA